MFYQQFCNLSARFWPGRAFYQNPGLRSYFAVRRSAYQHQCLRTGRDFNCSAQPGVAWLAFNIKVSGWGANLDFAVRPGLDQTELCLGHPVRKMINASMRIFNKLWPRRALDKRAHHTTNRRDSF